MTRRYLVLLVGALMMGSTAQAQSKRLVLDDLKVVGKVQKPEITIIITRQNLNMGYELKLEESFIPKIVESVDQKPF